MNLPSAAQVRAFVGRITIAVGVLILGLAAPSAAGANDTRPLPAQQVTTQGKYKVKFSEVSNNCKRASINLENAAVSIDRVRGRAIRVTIPMVPIMRGAVRRGGKFRAKAKKGKTAIAGLDGRFSAGGRIDKKSIQFVFIAEYFRGKEPLCTQSWNASGTRQ